MLKIFKWPKRILLYDQVILPWFMPKELGILLYRFLPHSSQWKQSECFLTYEQIMKYGAYKNRILFNYTDK